jgi:glycosyltransferase involved in cell wall biosynthesis
MRIALIAPTYLPAHRANTIQVMKMAQAITNLNHQVVVFVPYSDHDNHEGVIPWEQLAELYGLSNKFQLEWLHIKPWMRRYDYGYLAVHAARKWRAELVYTRLPQAAVLAARTTIDTVYEVHDLPQGYVNPRLLRNYLRAPGARRLIVISKALYNDIVEHYDIPNITRFTLVAFDGVDIDRYRHLPEPRKARLVLSDEFNLNIDVDRFTVGYTGHFYSGRGVSLILDIAERLPLINFLLVGGESEKVKQVRQELESRNIENVILAGFIPNSKVALYQAASDVLIMPYQHKVAGSSGGDISRYLSPMKLFEYMACGRAILSSDLPVFREVLNRDNAILISAEDINQWVANIELLRQDMNTRKRLAIQAKHVVEQYTWDARAEQILDGLP